MSNIVEDRTPAGVPVITQRIPGSHSVEYAVSFATGSRDETKDIRGLAHLLEHCVFRATATRDSRAMSKEIEGAGGYTNAYTGLEETTYIARSISDTAEVAKDILSDVVVNTLLDQKDIDLERKIVLQECSMSRNDPEDHVYDIFAENFWKDNALCQTPLGDEKIVEVLGSTELRKFYEERYGAPNMAVVAAGDVEHDDIVQWASEKFDGMQGKMRIERQRPDVPGRTCVITEGTSEHSQCIFGFPATAPNDRMRVPVKVLCALMGGGMSSRLFDEVREKKGLVYDIHSWIGQYSDASYLATHFSCTPDNVTTVLDTCFATLKDMKENGFTKESFNIARNTLKGMYIRANENIDRMVSRMVSDHNIFGKCFTLEETLAGIDAVTEDDLSEAIDLILDADHLNVTVLGKKHKTLKKFDIDSIDL